MYSSNKILSLFAILVVMFATSTISSPMNPMKRQSPPDIHVSSPGPGPFVVESNQSVSWWCNSCETSDNINIEIIRRGKGVVFTETDINGLTGDYVLFIDPEWAVSGPKYFARVSLRRDRDVSGVSQDFTFV